LLSLAGDNNFKKIVDVFRQHGELSGDAGDLWIAFHERLIQEEDKNPWRFLSSVQKFSTAEDVIAVRAACLAKGEDVDSWYFAEEGDRLRLKEPGAKLVRPVFMKQFLSKDEIAFFLSEFSRGKDGQVPISGEQQMWFSEGEENFHAVVTPVVQRLKALLPDRYDIMEVRKWARMESKSEAVPQVPHADYTSSDRVVFLLYLDQSAYSTAFHMGELGCENSFEDEKADMSRKEYLKKKFEMFFYSWDRDYIRTHYALRTVGLGDVVAFRADHVHFGPGGYFTDEQAASAGRKVIFFSAGPPGNLEYDQYQPWLLTQDRERFGGDAWALMMQLYRRYNPERHYH
jgi:hypothetical protein